MEKYFNSEKGKAIYNALPSDLQDQLKKIIERVEDAKAIMSTVK